MLFLASGRRARLYMIEVFYGPKRPQLQIIAMLPIITTFTLDDSAKGSPLKREIVKIRADFDVLCSHRYRHA